MSEHSAVLRPAQEPRKFELVYLKDDSELMLWNCPVCGRSVVHFRMTADEYKIHRVEATLDYGDCFREHNCPPIECGETWWSGSEWRP